MTVRIDRDEGREVFGRDPMGYAGARPSYPARVYELMVERCGLAPGCRTLEVGAGSGLATRALVERGARPVVAVEPDRGFETALSTLARTTEGNVLPLFTPFESADLEAGAFDLVVCATSFHWLDRAVAPQKLGDCLRPGGWLVLFWNVFGDPRQPDPFHEATTDLLSKLAASPSQSEDRALPFALDREARAADMRAARADHDFTVEEIHWTLTLDPPAIRSLYSTWSSVARLPHAERESLLDQLESIASDPFDGVVERKMVTPVYLGRRA